LHPVGLLFPRINEDARSNSHQVYTQYVISIAFPLQQSLHEGVSVLRYTYMACLSVFFLFIWHRTMIL